MLTGWPFRSGASWSEEHACVPRPRHSLAVPSKCWLLPNADCSCLLSALQNLLLVLVLVLLLLAALLFAWSCLCGLNSLKRRSLQLDEGTSLLIKWMAMRQRNCLCYAGPIEKDSIRCFLATGLPTQSTSSTPRSHSPPWHAPWGFCQPLLLPVLAVCSCDAASFRALRGWGWHATFALHHTAPLWLNLHC